MGYLIFCGALYCVLLTVLGQQMCSDPINYTEMTSRYYPTRPIHLTCMLSVGTSQIRWWASSDPCGPFNSSHLCPDGNNVCNFDSTSIGNSFYHCCTPGGTVENSMRDCTQVHICTSINTSSPITSPPVAIYGNTLLLYVNVHAYPEPPIETEVHTHPINASRVTVFRLSPPSPLLIYEIALPIPSAAALENPNLMLFFVATFEEVCVGDVGDSTQIHGTFPLMSRDVDVDISTTNTMITQVPSISPSDELLNSQCDVNVKGLLAGVVVLGVAFVVLLLLSMMMMIVCYLRKKKLILSSVQSNGQPNAQSHSLRSLDTSVHHNSSPGPSPHPHQNQNETQLSPQSDSLPHQYQNETRLSPQSDPLPHQYQNGLRLSPQSPAGHATPTTTHPSSLELGYAQHQSHSGTTPLISFTTPVDSSRLPFSASPGVPSPLPPSYADTVEHSSAMSVVSEHVGSHYATVGGADGSLHRPEGSAARVSGGPIYSNSTIMGLASDVQLTGAETADQSNV